MDTFDDPLAGPIIVSAVIDHHISRPDPELLQIARASEKRQRTHAQISLLNLEPNKSIMSLFLSKYFLTHIQLIYCIGSK